MRRRGLALVFWSSLAVAPACFGEAPAPASHAAIDRAVRNVRKGWEKPGGVIDPNASGWISLFDALERRLDSYTKATTSEERHRALAEILEVESALASVSWTPAVETREALQDWLEPRIRLVQAERRLVESVARLPAPTSETMKLNRELWVRFVEDELDKALRDFEAAPTVARRQQALGEIRECRNVLDARNRESSWTPGTELEAALDAMFQVPNFIIRMDLPTITPIIEKDLVPTGPIERKGRLVMVTAGPKSGFGLLPSDNSVLFFNRQLYSTSTDLSDFQRQLASDPRGARAARLYEFQAATYDNAELTITSELTSSGLVLTPSYRHDVNANITSSPKPNPRAAVSRAIISFAGYDQSAIRDQVQRNAIPKMRARIESEALEQGLEKTSEQASIQNQTLANYLIGNNQVVYGKLLLKNLALSSRPEGATAGGVLGDQGGIAINGAEWPRPRYFTKPDPGVTVDLQLTSILTNLARSRLARKTDDSVTNMMIIARPRPPGAPMSAGFQVVRNADDATFFKGIEEAKKTGDPKVLALRIRCPEHPPEFSADASGKVVAIIHDLEIDVPYTSQSSVGGGLIGLPPARALRIRVAKAEVTAALKVEPANATDPVRLFGKIESFEPGAGLQVFALESEDKEPTPINVLKAALVVGVFRQRLIGRTVEAPLGSLPLKKFAIRSISDLDPSGWIRVDLSRVANPAP
jgi:hypothetical protein